MGMGRWGAEGRDRREGRAGQRGVLWFRGEEKPPADYMGQTMDVEGGGEVGWATGLMEWKAGLRRRNGEREGMP